MSADGSGHTSIVGAEGGKTGEEARHALRRWWPLPLRLWAQRIIMGDRLTDIVQTQQRNRAEKRIVMIQAVLLKT